jgi:hypothetical protein
LIYTCIEEFGIRIPIVDATDAAALRVLSMPWGHYESVAVYDRTASLRRDRHGNRFVYDTITRPDARRIVEQDAAYYERIASRSPDPTGHQTLLKLCL